jgi:hypothetical protein
VSHEGRPTAVAVQGDHRARNRRWDEVRTGSPCRFKSGIPSNASSSQSARFRRGEARDVEGDLVVVHRGAGAAQMMELIAALSSEEAPRVGASSPISPLASTERSRTSSTDPPRRSRGRSRERAPTAAPGDASSAAIAGPVECTRATECVAKLRGEPAVCNRAGRCAAVASPDCRALFEPEDLLVRAGSRRDLPDALLALRASDVRVQRPLADLGNSAFPTLSPEASTSSFDALSSINRRLAIEGTPSRCRPRCPSPGTIGSFRRSARRAGTI